MRRLGKGGLVACLVWAVGIVACGDDDLERLGENPDGGGPASDSGQGSPDASAGDFEGPALFADPDNALSPPPAREVPGACVEDESDARGTPLGCEVSTCREISHACCVGRAECCSAPEALVDLDFADCTSDCVPGGSLFGSPLPTFNGAFLAGGNAEFDSGLVLEERVDLRGETITVTTTVGVPTASCAGTCIETVGVSIAHNAPDNDTSHVRTIAGLLWSNSRMHLIIGERSIANWPSTVDGEWTLEIAADGRVRVASNTSDGVVDEERDEAILPSEAFVVLHGHNVNAAGGETGARLSKLNVVQRRCEMTRQWGARSAVRTGSSETPPLVGVRSPTSVRDGGGILRVAYMREGRLITSGRGDDASPDIWVAADEAYDALDTPPDVEPHSPELAMDDDELVLFYEAGGVIHRATQIEDETRLRFGNGVPLMDIVVPEAMTFAPTYASRGVGQEAALIVRVEWLDGSRPTLAAFSLRDGSVAQLHDLLPTDSLGEEIGDPELFIRNRLYQVYVPYREGTRWRLAHLTSEDFIFWNIADAEALVAGGDEELFGPRAPDTVVEAEGVELFYERFDGVEETIGRIFRRTPLIATIPDAR